MLTAAKAKEMDSHARAKEMGSDEFRMFCHKVVPCSKRFAHDWTACPFLHSGERARRRDPRTHSYTAELCPEGGSCGRGDSCPMAHNLWEYWLHPTRYRTQLCTGGAGCTRRVCFFAHSLQELRMPGMAGTGLANSTAASSPHMTAASGTTAPVVEPPGPAAWLPQQLPLYGAADTSGSCFSSPLPSSVAQLEALMAGVSPAADVPVHASHSASFSSNTGAINASSNAAWQQLLPGDAGLCLPVASAAVLLPVPQPCPAAGAGLVSLSLQLAQQVESQHRQEVVTWLQLAACRSQLQALASLPGGTMGLGAAEPLLMPRSSSGVAQLLQPWDNPQLWDSL